MKWKYFVSACIVVGAALLKAGAPLFTVIAGIGLAAIVNFLQNRGKVSAERPSAIKAR